MTVSNRKFATYFVFIFVVCFIVSGALLKLGERGSCAKEKKVVVEKSRGAKGESHHTWTGIWAPYAPPLHVSITDIVSKSKPKCDDRRSLIISVSGMPTLLYTPPSMPIPKIPQHHGLTSSVQIPPKTGIGSNWMTPGARSMAIGNITDVSIFSLSPIRITKLFMRNANVWDIYTLSQQRDKFFQADGTYLGLGLKKQQRFVCLA